MYEYELFPVENGYGYKILHNGNVIQVQEYMPRVSGFVVMSEDEAKAEALVLIARLDDGN